MEKKLDTLFEFLLELDKEKNIFRQTYLSDGKRKENDAEHAWHMAVMALLLKDYAAEKIDIEKTIKMILLHDVVEIDAGDTYAYDEAGQSTHEEREDAAAKRIYGILEDDLADELYGLWREFEDRSSPEARFARTMDCIQPLLLNAATSGRAWVEHGIDVSQVLKRNEKTAEGSEVLWDYAKEKFIIPNVEKGRLTDREGNFSGK